MLQNETMQKLASISPSKPVFFPRDPQFWLYHVAGVALFITVQISVDMFMGDKPRLIGFEAIAFGIWVIGFTLSALILRTKYNQWSQRGLATPMIVIRSLGFVMFLSLCIFASMALIAMRPYWDKLMAQELSTNPDQTGSGYLLELAVGNLFSGAVILFCWLFIYISISKTREVKKSSLTNLRLQNSLKEAQLSNLANQLNPHFLFNSLNNIRFMIHENADRADEMITSLSQVLRYSLESSQHEKLLLHKELDIINHYVDIVTIQFEKRFRFSMNISENLHHYLVPPMLLQMLIENAVKHGVERMEHGSSIIVTAQEKHDKLHIEVINDAPVQLNMNDDSTGIGLKNIEQRLNILYGPTAEFSTDLNGDQFRAKVCLPLETG